MKTYEYAVKASGLENVVWFDVECVKEAISNPAWDMKSRTVPVMVGVVEILSDRIVVYQTETEEETVGLLQTYADLGVEMRYSATLKYDEMVVVGRWTYGRRPMAEKPGPWKAVKNGSFRNIRKDEKETGIVRDSDILSSDIPEAWFSPNYRSLIELHNLRDVLLLVASDPEVTLTAEAKEAFELVCRN